MPVELTLDIFLIVISSINIIIQVIGCKALLSIYRNGQEKVADLYIISLSTIELVCSSFVCIEYIFYFTDVMAVYVYLAAFHFSAAAFIYYLSMFYITGDKLLEVILNIRLPVYWNVEKAKVLLLFTWICGGVFGISLVLSYWFNAFDYQTMLLRYFFPILDIGFLLLAVPTYIFLFKMFRQARTKRPSGTRPSIIVKDENNIRVSWFRIFCQSRFYTAALLIFAFIILVIIPDLVIVFTPIPMMTPHLRLICALLPRQISFVVDASIYMLTMKSVKQKVRRIFCRPWCCHGTVGVLPGNVQSSVRTLNHSL